MKAIEQYFAVVLFIMPFKDGSDVQSVEFY